MLQEVFMVEAGGIEPLPLWGYRVKVPSLKPPLTALNRLAVQ